MRAEPRPEDGVLWRLIESRDRAFATAHAAFQAMMREAQQKDGEIRRLTAWARELEVAPRQKDAEIARLVSVLAERERSLADKEKEIEGVKEKEAEIHSLNREAQARVAVIESLTREAQARLAIIEQLQASREYKLGVVALHPWRTLKEKL
jgi:predicted RNase H-like nuclease (RuvC/YqgF family)